VGDNLFRRGQYREAQRQFDFALQLSPGHADVGVLSYPTATRTLNVLPLRSETMVLVTHPSHRLAKRKQVTPGDLTGEKFVAFDRDLAVRKAIDRSLKQHGVKVEVVMEFDNVETIKQAIGIAAGVSILPRPTVVMESGMRTLATVPLALSGLARPIGLIYRRGKRLTPAVSRFIETLRKADEPPSE
jgi:DNA-binding transcriptional LysR family regulator